MKQSGQEASSQWSCIIIRIKWNVYVRIFLRQADHQLWNIAPSPTLGQAESCNSSPVGCIRTQNCCRSGQVSAKLHVNYIHLGQCKVRCEQRLTFWWSLCNHSTIFVHMLTEPDNWGPSTIAVLFPAEAEYLHDLAINWEASCWSMYGDWQMNKPPGSMGHWAKIPPEWCFAFPGENPLSTISCYVCPMHSARPPISVLFHGILICSWQWWATFSIVD